MIAALWISTPRFSSALPQLAPMVKKGLCGRLARRRQRLFHPKPAQAAPCPLSLSSKGQLLFSTEAQLPQLRAKRDGTGPLFDSLPPYKRPCSKRRYTTICIAALLLYKQNPFFAFFCQPFAWSAFLLPLLWCSQSLCALRQTFFTAAALKCRFAAAKHLRYCKVFALRQPLNAALLRQSIRGIAKYLRCGDPKCRFAAVLQSICAGRKSIRSAAKKRPQKCPIHITKAAADTSAAAFFEKTLKSEPINP